MELCSYCKKPVVPENIEHRLPPRNAPICIECDAVLKEDARRWRESGGCSMRRTRGQ